MKEKVRFLGLDGHAETIAVGVAEADPRAELGHLREAGRIYVSLEHSGPVNSLRAPKGNPLLRFPWSPKNLAIGDWPRHEHWRG